MQGTARRDFQAPSGDLVIAPRIPHGLAAAVEGLTREVIRHRPEDIYVFAAQHFEELLKLRDEFGAVTNLPGKSTNTAALREMNQSLKKRDCSSIPSPFNRNKNSPGERGSGWSMNETARVLERHRSIFGDKGRKVSPEEIRALQVNEKENKSKTYTKQRRRGSNERFVQRKLSREFEDEKQRDKNISRSDSNGNLKIISQIPKLPGSNGGAELLAKDIKSELRKNRNSSRDVRGYKQKAEKRTDRFDGSAKKASLPRKSEFTADNSIDREEKLQKMNETDNQKYETDNKRSLRSFAKIPRTLSMDRVRKFVVEKFRASESWEELGTTDYVGRVQEVIDGAAPSILERVKELNSTARVKSGRRSAERGGGYESIDESTSTSTRSDKSNQTDDVRSKSAMSVSRRSRRSMRRTESRSKISTTESRGADSLEGIETLASETEQVMKESKNSHGIIQGPAANAAVIDSVGIISVIKKTINGFNGELLSDPEDITDPVKKSSSGSPSISLPAVRPPSSKNNSRSVSRTECDDFVLPPIPPEVPRSAKLKEEIVFPNLLQVSVAGSGNCDLAELDLPDPPDGEIFKDSLNVTPEIGGTPRPDSLEPGENIAERRAKLNELKGKTDPEEIAGSEERQHGIEEKLMNVVEDEKKIAAILLADVEGIVEGDGEDGTVAPVVSVKEKLIEIQEAQVRLNNILDRDAGKQELEIRETLEDSANPEIKEKLIEIQESEKRIEKLLQAENREVEEDREPDTMIKEKLMEVEDTAKRIERILDFEAKEIKGCEPESGISEKYIEIEEAQKKMDQIFETDIQEVEKVIHENQDTDSIPKTPFIPEIPCEYVTSPGEEEVSENPVEERKPTPSVQSLEKLSENIETDKEEKNVDDLETPGDRLTVERITSATPDSLGTSYVLTEGSPYEIPESVTTVIIPERQLESASSDVVEIVLENEPTDCRDFPSESHYQVEDVSLRNILDNFGEVVHKEPLPISNIDVDLIRGLKTPEDLAISKKDLGLITEEEDDREIVETENAVPDVGAEHAQEDATTLQEIRETEEVEEIPNPDETEEVEEIPNPDETELEETDTLPRAEVNATDSGVTDSTDEVKETTISDDGVNTVAESSVQSSQSEGAGILLGVRNSESSNEVKETTISDQPVDQGGKNLYGLGQQCHGVAPNVPELNLDSLQDITVSSFQLSDDATAEEEDSEARPVSENEIPEHDSKEETLEFPNPEKVDEDSILKEQALVEEAPDLKENPHPTRLDNENLENSEYTSEKLQEEERSLKSADSQMETVSLNDFKALEANVAAEFLEEVIPADIADEKGEESEKIPETTDQELNEIPQTTSNETPDLSIPEKEPEALEDPPKAEITNDLIDNEASGDKMEYHIYVPELITASEDFSTTTESSTFNSAATKIQAGVRGFLTRRRLQSAQRRSSTLDSVPSIQDSLATDATHLEPIVEVGFSQAATTIQSGYRGYKARQRLRREDAVQKTTLSIENIFGGNGLRHTGEFHDCLPLPVASDGVGENSINDVISDSEIHEDEEMCSVNNRSRETTERRHRDEENRIGENMGIIVDYPLDERGMNLVTVVTASGNESTLQTQYLNFITSVEEVPREMESSLVSDKVLDDTDYTFMKSTVGIENLPMDISGENSSVSLREPLAVPGTPNHAFIEELSNTEEREIDVEPTEDVTGDEIKSDTIGDSLDLPGLSLDPKGEVAEDVPRVVFEEQVNPEIGVALEPADSLPLDANSLGTMSLSMNVDDMLGLGGESDLPSKIKPILEVTVTPRDLLKLTNRSEGSLQASRDRIESPVTMMQIVPKSIEEKSDRSEETAGDEEREKSIKNPEDSRENSTEDPTNTADANLKI